MVESRFVSAYSDFSLRLPSPLTGRASSCMIAEFTLSADVSELAAHINAVAQKAIFYEKPPHIRFVLDSILCTLFKNRGSASSFRDRDQALEFLEKLIAFLNHIHRNRDSIRPNYKTQKSMPVLDLFRLLPRSNCGKCGFASCMAFAASLSRHRTAASRCPWFGRPISLQAVYPVLDDQGNLLSTVAIDVASTLPDAVSKREPARVDNPGRRPYDLTGCLAGISAEKANDSLPAPLTRRELDVLRLMAEGATNMEISKDLHISPHTVKSHIIHIFNKLGVYDRTTASVWAARHNLV